MQTNGTSTEHKPSYVFLSEKPSFYHVVDLGPFIRKWKQLAEDRGQ
jgi:hypothetical protein